MVLRHSPFVLLLWACLACGTVGSEPAWVIAPGEPGPDIPPHGRSLFDYLTNDNGRQTVPFPYEALVARLREKLGPDDHYLGQPLKQVLIPLGRSLQREAAAPDFFLSPRVVLAVDSDPATTPTDTGMLLRDRLFIAYLEAANVLEIISYNEAAARFEFQVVHDYRAGGDPQVIYARRLVCTACHQNAAPIFARPLWDETNANEHVSSRLETTGPAYHDIPKKLGIDIAYAIDNSTDRANEFTLTQMLWQQGCGSGESGSHCRAAMLVRALQYTFAGGRGFDDDSGDYRESLRRPVHESRQRLWPKGLWIPDPDIPNRRPVASLNLANVGTPDRVEKVLAERADITAASEPLAPRLPKSSWNPDSDAWVARAVSGLAQFLTPDDVRRIDTQLAKAPVDQTSTRAQCRVTRADLGDTKRIKLDCGDGTLSFKGLVYVDLSDGRLSGRLRNMQLEGEELGSLLVAGHQDSDGQMQLKLTRAGSPLRPRRTDGDELVRLELRWDGQATDRAVAELTVRHDGRILVETLHSLADNPDSSFAGGPFRRADIFPELFDSLGLGQLTWCCTHDTSLPPPEVEPVAPALEQPRLAAFLKACAGCHRSNAPFPPNFLAGGAEQVTRNIAHCGERIQYRLAMWDIDPEDRAKTPMPPLHSIGMLKDAGRHWMSGLLPELRKALHEIAGAEAHPLPAEQITIARPYFELRPCLPVS